MSHFRLVHNRARKHGLSVATAKQPVELFRTIASETLVCYTQVHDIRLTSLPLTMERREFLVGLTFVGRKLQNAGSPSFQPEISGLSKKHMWTK